MAWHLARQIFGSWFPLLPTNLNIIVSQNADPDQLVMAAILISVKEVTNGRWSVIKRDGLLS